MQVFVHFATSSILTLKRFQEKASGDSPKVQIISNVTDSWTRVNFGGKRLVLLFPHHRGNLLHPAWRTERSQDSSRSIPTNWKHSSDNRYKLVLDLVIRPWFSSSLSWLLFPLVYKIPPSPSWLSPLCEHTLFTLSCFHPKAHCPRLLWQYRISVLLPSLLSPPEEVLKEELLSLSICLRLLSCRELSPLLPSASNASALAV